MYRGKQNTFDGPIQKAIAYHIFHATYREGLDEYKQFAERIGANPGNFSKWMSTGKGLSLEKSILALGLIDLHMVLKSVNEKVIIEVRNNRGHVVASNEATLYDSDD